MKKNFLKKGIVSLVALLLAVVFVAPFLSPIVVEAADNSNTAASSNDYKDTIEKLKTIKKDIKKWDKRIPRATYKQNIKNMGTQMQSYSAVTESFISWMKKEGASFDSFDLNTCIDVVSKALACIPVCGGVISGAIDILYGLVELAMGGQEPPDPMTLMEDRLNQRFDGIADQLDEMEEQISELSNQVSASTDKIINAISIANDDQDARNRLSEFMSSSGVGDFSYDKLRNYLYGSYDPSKNSSASTAYYSLLLNAQYRENCSPDTIRDYYDLLYAGIISYYDDFKGYVVGNEGNKPMVQCYYDVVSKRPDITAELGKSAEMAAIEFAYDLYQTQLKMDELLLMCNNYQLAYMIAYEIDKYDYSGYNATEKTVYLTSIKNGTYYLQTQTREEEIVSQLLKDLAYILNLDGSYVAKDKNDNISYLNTETIDGNVYAKVLKEQTIYLNRLPQELFSRFDLDPNLFVYYAEKMDENDKEDGIFKVTDDLLNSTVYLVYNNEVISSITFIDASVSESLGDGTLENPYLISSPDQFKNIGNEPDKYYRLIKDIDFKGETISGPIGGNKSFSGILDGNGYTVSNLNVGVEANYDKKENIGVFCSIEGTLRDIQFSNINVNYSIDSSVMPISASVSKFKCGIIAGSNYGQINNCVLKDCNVTVNGNTTNEGAERSVYYYIGGVVGENNGDIFCVEINGLEINANSTHNFNGGNVGTNENNILVGGICGYNYGNISYAIVNTTKQLKAYAKSIYDPNQIVKPYVVAKSGAITAGNYNKTLINTVYASAPNLFVNTALDCKSGYGEYYKNVTSNKYDYFPGFDNSKKEDIDTIKACFTVAKEYKVELTDATEGNNQYKAGDILLHDFKLKVNGEDITDFAVIDVYGFDTYNEDTENKLSDIKVTTLIVATINGSSVLLTADYNMEVSENYVKNIDFSSATLKDKSGNIRKVDDKVFLNDETIVSVELKIYYACQKDPDQYGYGVIDVDKLEGLTFTDASGSETDFATIGDKKMVIYYTEDVSCDVDINVVCGTCNTKFNYADTTYYTHSKHVDATCQHGGYDEYTCKVCGTVTCTNRTQITDHKWGIRGYSEPTCKIEGKSQEIYCQYEGCGIVAEKSVIISMKAHDYDFSKSTAEGHYCSNLVCPDGCSAKEHSDCVKIEHGYIPHEYTVSETVNDEGIRVYTYVCSVCNYVKTEEDDNFITIDQKLAPTVVVSNGYVLNGGDIVTVFVDLINNPGVKGATFGIRYHERLELIGWEDGTFFKNNMGSGDAVSAVGQVSGGYNFSWAGAATVYPLKHNGNLVSGGVDGGNLLKLTFRVPEDADETDEYYVRVVYDSAEGKKYGFVVDESIALTVKGEKPQNNIERDQWFMTKEGVISVVDYLPGDYNNDGCVDIIDALSMSQELVLDQKITTEKEKRVDVDLDGYFSTSDITNVLQAITGGYGERLLYSEYDIILNPGYNMVDAEGKLIELEPLKAQLYGENDTYGEAGLKDIEREGYKFLGWYTDLVGGTRVTASENIKYVSDQKVQMLYAHWELNTITFDIGDATTPVIDTKYYLGEGEQLVSLNTGTKEKYDVMFQDAKVETNYKIFTMYREITKWNVKGTDKFYELTESIDLSETGLGNIELVAVWSDWEWENGTPELPKIGYYGVKWYKQNREIDNYLININDFDSIKALTPVENGDRTLYGYWEGILTSKTYSPSDRNFNTPIVNDYYYFYKLGNYFNINDLIKEGYTKVEVTFTYNIKVDGDHFKTSSNGGYGYIVSNGNIYDIYYDGIFYDSGMVEMGRNSYRSFSYSGVTNITNLSNGSDYIELNIWIHPWGPLDLLNKGSILDVKIYVNFIK